MISLNRPACTLLLIILAALATSCTPAPPTTQSVTQSVTLRFTAHIDGAPLIFDDARYDASVGEYTFSIQNFRFIVSNIQLEGDNQTYLEPDSYHLVRFDTSEDGHRIELENVPLESVDRIGFSLGVDGEANGSIETRGALDPNSPMAWNWEVGYKFLVFEGRLHSEQGVRPLVYHVGFNENRRDYSFNLPDEAASELLFEVDIMKLFDGKTPIDIGELPTVKFDRGDAAIMANNYAHMVSLSSN